MKNIFKNTLKPFLCFFLISLLSGSYAQQQEFGARFGINQSRKDDNAFHYYEFFILNNLPSFSKTDTIADFGLKLESTLGLLEDGSINSILFSFGPVVGFDIYENKIFVRGGISPSLMTNHTFQNLELGGFFNFMSHITLMIWFIDKVGFSYRFEHISNAGFYENNPGINIHFFEIRYNMQNLK